ncbi:MAG: helix-turn-helix domain-containing protein [Bacteroidales bacterium]|nr:helix-turn-helix domain-containing protein [Bacteroidales bacterium]
MTTNSDLKHIIVELKTKLNLTQAQLAERLGVNASYLSSVVNGRFPLTENLMTRIKLLEENNDMRIMAQKADDTLKNAKLSMNDDSTAIIAKLMGMIDNLQTQVNEDRKLLNILVDRIINQKQ